jgi:hypothetical protein
LTNPTHDALIFDRVGAVIGPHGALVMGGGDGRVGLLPSNLALLQKLQIDARNVPDTGQKPSDFLFGDFKVLNGEIIALELFSFSGYVRNRR